MKPLSLYIYWSCLDCGRIVTTEKALPGPCTACGTNCWQSPPATIHTEDAEDEE